MTTTETDVEEPSLEELISLRGRKAVITGGAQGIGYAVARRFAEAGATVVLGDKNEVGVVEAAKVLSQQYGSTVYGVGLDVGDSGSVAAFADRGMHLLSGIDIWINNAGIYPGSSLLEMTDEMWDRVSNVNLRGAFLGCREAAKRMIGQPSERYRVIVNIASVAAVRGRKGLTHYSAAKSGVLGLTRGAAVELAEHRIRVLAVTPSMAETPGVQEMRQTAREANSSGEMLRAMEQAVVKSFPMGRTGKADEVARVVLFCASDLAAFMTGSNIFVDGGLTAT